MHTVWRNRQTVNNSILRGLSPLDFQCIRPHLERITLYEGAILQEPDIQVQYVNFVESGLISLTTIAAATTFETAMVGSRGFDPVAVILGASTSSHRSLVLISGAALRIRTDDIRNLMRDCPSIRDHFLQYVHSLMTHRSQTALCGAQHRRDQRLACWLSLACDALDDNVLPITQNHLSSMLGFRRVTVSLALKQLDDAGLVQRVRGVLQITDRRALAERSCCCYKAVSGAYAWIG